MYIYRQTFTKKTCTATATMPTIKNGAKAAFLEPEIHLIQGLAFKAPASLLKVHHNIRFHSVFM